MTDKKTPLPLRILLAEDDADVRELIEFFLESEYQAEVTGVSSSVEGIAHLKKGNPFDLVVSDLNMLGGSGADLFQYLKSKSLKIPFILCSSEEASEHPEFNGFPFWGYAKKPRAEEGLRHHISRFLESRKQGIGIQTLAAEKPSHVPISMELVKRVKSAPADLFIRLGDKKFIKLFNENEPIDPARMKQYEDKGLKEFHIQNEKSEKIYQLLLAHIISSKTNQKDFGGLHHHFESTFELLNNITQVFPLTNESKKAARLCLEESYKVIGKIPELKDLFVAQAAREPENEKSRKTSQILLVTSVAFSMLEILGLDNEDNKRRISFAATLHDISVTNSALRKYRTREQIGSLVAQGNTSFSETDIMLYLDHPNRGAQIAAQFDDIPEGVPTLIMMHHERPDAKGYPQGLGPKNIPLLSSIFITAHEFIEDYLGLGSQFDLGTFLATHHGWFTEPHFDKIGNCLVRIYQKLREGLPKEESKAS